MSDLDFKAMAKETLIKLLQEEYTQDYINSYFDFPHAWHNVSIIESALREVYNKAHYDVGVEHGESVKRAIKKLEQEAKPKAEIEWPSDEEEKKWKKAWLDEYDLGIGAALGAHLLWLKASTKIKVVV